ncbi:MAG: sulfatase [Myxococcota bacterium]
MRRHRLNLGAAVLRFWAAACLTSIACAPPSPAPAPSVLLITVDTLRPDYLGMNGYDRPTSPAIDDLLSRGFYFEQAVAPVARTTPALAALLTGTYPHTNGVRTLTDKLSADVGTLTEAMAQSGYQTLAVVTNQVLTRERGLSRGFDVYDVAPDARTAEATTDSALELLKSLRGDAPAFVWIHYIDPHVPYDGDPEIARRMDPSYSGPYQDHFGRNGQAGRRGSHEPFPEDLPKGLATHRNPLSEAVNAHIRRLYAADIRALDDQVGRLVGAARERFGSNLLIVFTADHGESLGEHDLYFDHGDYVYNAGTRIPLGFVLPPRHPLHGSARCGGWVSLVDVLPTLFELLGRDVPDHLLDQIEGRPLTACMRGEADAALPVFAESGYSYYFADVKRRKRNDVAGRLRSVVRGEWKLIWAPFAPEDEAWELYRVSEDPHEIENVYRPAHPAAQALRPLLARWADLSGPAPESRPLTPEDEAALRELGYLE